MTVADYGFETASVDHAAMALLAGGDDLFDLTQLAAASEPKPADITIAMQTMETSSPAVADHFLPERHGETLAPHLLVSAVDADPADRQLAPKTTQEATVAIHSPEDTTLAQLQHPLAPALAAADIFADTGEDLAGFQTAGGGHAPMGSGFFTPFTPAPILGGFHALEVLGHD
jgi:hypothetical protein